MLPPIVAEQPFTFGPFEHFHQLRVASMVASEPMLSTPVSPKKELKCAWINPRAFTPISIPSLLNTLFEITIPDSTEIGDCQDWRRDGPDRCNRSHDVQ